MKAQNDKRMDKRISSLLSTIDHGTNEPDKRFLDKLKEQSTAEFMAYSIDSNKQSQNTIPNCCLDCCMLNHLYAHRTGRCKAGLKLPIIKQSCVRKEKYGWAFYTGGMIDEPTT